MSATYAVRICYVDDSYWDDGSRYTHHTFTFDKLAEAVAFAREASVKGCECPGQCGKVRAFPEKRDIEVTRHSRTRVRWEP